MRSLSLFSIAAEVYAIISAFIARTPGMTVSMGEVSGIIGRCVQMVLLGVYDHGGELVAHALVLCFHDGRKLPSACGANLAISRVRC